MKNIILIYFLIIASSCQTIASLGETYEVLSGYRNNTYRVIYTMNGYGNRETAKEKVLVKASEICQDSFILDSLGTQVKTNEHNKGDMRTVVVNYIAIADITCIL